MRTTKPLAGQFKKVNLAAPQHVRELRAPAEHVAKFEIGQKLAVDQIFEVGQSSTRRARRAGAASPASSGAGAWRARVKTHGTHEYRRHGGSIGTNMTPGRTLPGLKMPGQYGNETVTAHNLKVARLMPEDDLVLIEGAVPGPKNQLVIVRGAVKKKNGGRKA